MSVFVGLFGAMGTGKSYEAMKYHVLPALKAGQKVATNIDGVFQLEQQQNIAKYVGRSLEEVQSLLIRVPRTKEELFKPGIFPNPLDWSAPSLIPPGSKVVLDECSTVFKAAPPDHIMRYLTEQRHGVDAKGNTGSTVIISQSPQVHFSVRHLMSVIYYFTTYGALAPVMSILRKFKLGKDYRAEVYTDMSKTVARSKPDNLVSRIYDVKVFPCYKSANTAEFKKLTVDGRATIFGNRFVVFTIPLFLLIASYSGYYLIKKFSMPAGGLETAKQPASTIGSSITPVSAATPAPSASTPFISTATATAARNEFDGMNSKDYQYVGRYFYNDLPIYIIKHTSGAYRYVMQPEVKRIIFAGPATMLELYDGTKITSYTGSASSAQNNNIGANNATQTNTMGNYAPR